MADGEVQASRRLLWPGGEVAAGDAPLRARPSREERARMVAECCRPGASLTAVARRHGVERERLRVWVHRAGRAGELNRRPAGPLPPFVRLVLEEGELPGDEARGRPHCRASGCRWAGRFGGRPGGALAALAEIDPGTSLRIVLARSRAHFRKGLDGLAAAMERELGLDPHSGVAAVFRCAGRGDRIKVLWWDGSGLVLAHKRLERGCFLWPPEHHGAMRFSRAGFELLFAGLDWRGMLHPRVVGPTGGRREEAGRTV